VDVSMLFDRLARRETDVLPTEPLIGRYLVADEQVSVNGIVGAGFVVADIEGQVSVHSEDGRQGANGQPPASERPLDLTTNALEEIAETLRYADSFADLAGHDCSPLASPDPTQGRLNKLDGIVEMGAPHLLATAQRPHSRLEATVEHMPVARARRVPPRSIEYLAAHSEDWQRRTPGGLVPRKVLARRLDERLDVYENRVVARLTEKVIDYLQRREAALLQLGAFFRDIADFHKLLGGGHQLVQRLSGLWDAKLTAAASDERPEALAAQLEGVRRRVSAILGSDLYRAVPRLADVGGTLLTTNVLASDQDYRRLPPLWDGLISASDEQIDDEEWYRREQARCENFELYCRLLALRALLDCGLQPSPDDWGEPDAPTQVWRLDDGPMSVTLHANRRDGLVLTRRQETILRIVPIASEICGLSSELVAQPARVSSRIRTIVEECDGEIPTAVLYLGTRGQREQLPESLACAANGVPDVLDQVGSNCVVVPVSPLDLLTLERVARLVRYVLLARQMREYPPSARCPRAVRAELTAAFDWLAVDAEDVDLVNVLLPPDAGRSAELTNWVAQQLKGLRPKLQGPRREALTKALAAVAADDVLAQFAALQKCPICPRSGKLRARDRDSFAVTCDGCGAEWGLRVCECGNRIPFLRPNDPRQVEAPVSERLDLSVGRDVLTAPCPLDEREYPCRACGRCECRREGDAPCARCQAHSPSSPTAARSVTKA
jgi:hypothetical protein